MTQSWAKPTLAKYRPTATLLGLRTISGHMRWFHLRFIPFVSLHLFASVLLPAGVMVPYGLGCILLALLTAPCMALGVKQIQTEFIEDTRNLAYISLPYATRVQGQDLGAEWVKVGLVGCSLLRLWMTDTSKVILHSTAWYDPLNPNWIHVLPKSKTQRCMGQNVMIFEWTKSLQVGWGSSM